MLSTLYLLFDLILYILATQNVLCSPAALAPPGGLSVIWMLRPTPDLLSQNLPLKLRGSGMLLPLGFPEKQRQREVYERMLLRVNNSGKKEVRQEVGLGR